MTKYLALFLCLVCLAIAARLAMPLSPDSLAVMLPGEVANALFARSLGAGLFVILGLGMFMGFYWETKKR